MFRIYISGRAKGRFAKWLRTGGVVWFNGGDV